MKIRPFQLWTIAVALSAVFATRNVEAAPAPSITTQPRSQTNFFGSNVVFTVAASGQTPLFYQWSFDGTNLTDNGHISGSTTTNLTVNSITMGDAGNYRVVVTNSHGSATSSNATLTVLVPAAITSQPTNQSVFLSNNVTFAAAATGTLPLNYRWYFNGTALADGGRVSGSGTANLTIFNVQTNDAGSYQFVVTNNYRMATSAVATLTVLVPAAITIQPTNQSVLLSNNVSFTAAATGTAPLNYQWYFNGAPLSDGGGISGSATTNLNLSNVQTNEAGNYQLVVTNNYGSATSSIATLIVLAPPAITIQPTNQAALIGSTIVFSSGATSQSPASYQWLKDGGALINGGRISGADTPTLTISNLQMSDVGDYQFEASNTNGTAASTPASLMIVPLVGWGVNYYGEQTFPLTLTNVMAIATGDANLSYLNLMLKADSSVMGWGEVIGTSNYTITVPAGLSNAVAISAGYTHGLVLENDGTVTGFGDNSSGEANPPGGLIGVATVAAGWDWSLALKNDGTVVAWGDNSYGEATPPAGLSNVVAISAGGVHGLALKNDGTIVGWGLNTVGEGTSPAGLSNVVAIAAGYYHNLALQSDGTVVAWGGNVHGESSVPAGLSNVVAIAASYTLSLALRNDGTVVAWGDNFYGQSPAPPGLSNVVAIAAGGEYGLALVQNPATHVPPAIWWQGETNQTVPSGQTFLLNPYVNGSQPMSFQWYLNGSPLVGQTNSWLMVQSIQPSQAGNYQFTASNNYGVVTSQVAAVIESPGILNQPINQSSLAGGTVTFGVTAAGSGTLFYQWYFNGSPLADDSHVSGSATASLTISNVQSNDVGSYELVVTNTYGSATSQAATFTLLLPAAITIPPVSQSVLLSNNVAFFAVADGTLPLNYQWYFNGAPLTNGGRISGATTTNLVLSNVQASDAGPYQLIATNNYGSSTSTVATLTVNVPAMITSQPTNQSVILNSNASFSASAAGDAPLVFQWYFNGAPMSDGGRVNGSATGNLMIANAQTNDAGTYQMVVTNEYGTATSTVATLTVLLPAAITASPTNRTVLLGSNATFSVTAIGTAPLSYTWYSNGIALVNGGRISGVNSNTLTISNTQTNDSGAAYQAIVANSYGMATSSVATLTVLAPVQITGQPVSQAVLLGSNVTFSVIATGSALAYQWFFDGTPLSDGARISGSATSALTISDVQSSDAGGYVAIVTNLLSSATSQTASLTPQAVLAPSTRYVALTSTNPMPPYLDWSTAATNIQDAVDAAVAGDSVLVSNGVYNTGGRIVYGSTSNRVVVNKAVMVQSMNGPAATTIDGFLGSPLGTFHPGRCVYLTNGASLVGFALTNGGSGTSGDTVLNQSGGGTWCESSSAVISNCVLAGNSATTYGGGAFRGTLFDCVLTNNGGGFGGGAASNTLIDCTLAHNVANRQNLNAGGGAAYCTLSNCLVVGNVCNEGNGGGGAYFSSLTGCIVSNNVASFRNGGGVCFGVVNDSLICSNSASAGGGACSNVLNNCILWNNFSSRGGGGGALGSVLFNCTVVSNLTAPTALLTAGVYGGIASNSIVYYNGASNFLSTMPIYYCCVPNLPTNGLGNITNPPLFINLAGADFHLQSTSPCINSGNNSGVGSTIDFDGNPRIVGGTVDMGAYEYQTPTSVISYAWLQQYGLPTDGSVDFADLDGTTFNVYQDWIAGLNPTNSASVLAMQIPVINTNSTGLTLSWLSVNNRTYYLQRATNLVVQPAFSTIQSNISGQIGTTSFIDSTATNGGPYFYRVGVQQ